MKGILNEVVVVPSLHNLMISSTTFDDSWESKSFAEESCSEDAGDSLDCPPRTQKTFLSCIDDALAVLCSPGDKIKTKYSVSLALSPDSPPSLPRRSFDLGSKYKQMDLKPDRFGLSESEHQSGSSCSPTLPQRFMESGKIIDLQRILQPTRNHEVSSPPRRRRTFSSDECTRDHSVLPPSRCPSHKTKRARHLDPRSEKGKITLRASSDRYLLGSKELSTSQHLRRSCPA